MGVFDQFYIKYSVINGIGLPFSKSLLGFYIHLVTHHAHKLFLGGWGILLDGRLIGFARFALIELLSFFLCLSLTFFFSKAEKSPFFCLRLLLKESQSMDMMILGLSQMDYMAGEPIKSVPFICAIGVASLPSVDPSSINNILTTFGQCYIENIQSQLPL